MKILQVTGSFLPQKGGGPYFIHHLTSQLEEKGEKCRIVTTNRGTNTNIKTVPTDRAQSINVAGFPVSPTYPLVLGRVIHEFSPDIIHAHYPLPFYPEIAAAFARLKDIRLLLTCHGAFEMGLDSFIGIFGNVYNRTILHGPLASANRIHVSNEGIVQEFPMFERYESKISTIPMGVDTEWFDPETVTGGFPFNNRDIDTILFVGTLRRYKGLEDLIRAFDKIRERLDCQLVLVGDGPLRERVQSWTKIHGVDDDVEFVGRLDDFELRRAYASADVFVLPSPSIAESFGLVALEAMAMGVPTVVTAGSGIGRVLSGSKAGTVVPPRDPEEMSTAIVELLEDRKYHQSRASIGRRFMEEQFAWRSLVDEYRQLYAEVIR